MTTNKIDRQTIRLVVALVAFALCYASVLWSLAEQWATNSFYSYGFAVPLISAYIVWSRWSEIVDATAAPDYGWGVPLVLIGLTMQFLGQLGALASLQGLSLIP